MARKSGKSNKPKRDDALNNEGGNASRDRQPVNPGRKGDESMASPEDVQKRSREAMDTHKQPREHDDPNRPEPRTPKGEEI